MGMHNWSISNNPVLCKLSARPATVNLGTPRLRQSDSHPPANTRLRPNHARLGEWTVRGKRGLPKEILESAWSPDRHSPAFWRPFGVQIGWSQVFCFH